MNELDRSLIRKIESENFPLVALQSVQELRRQLGRAETKAILRALEMGASVEDLAEVLGITRQGAYYRLRTLRKEPEEEGEDTKEEEDVVVLHEEHPADSG